MRITEPSARYYLPDKIARFYDQLLEKLTSAARSQRSGELQRPAIRQQRMGQFLSSHWDAAHPPGQEPISEMNIVSPDYFRVLEMSIVRGRTFTAQDIANHPRVMIIDELAAQRFFPGQDPIGKQIDDPVTIGEPNQTGVPVTIVGVVPHTRNHAPGEQYDLRKLSIMQFVQTNFQLSIGSKWRALRMGRIRIRSSAQSSVRSDQSILNRPCPRSRRWTKTSPIVWRLEDCR